MKSVIAIITFAFAFAVKADELNRILQNKVVVYNGVCWFDKGGKITFKKEEKKKWLSVVLLGWNFLTKQNTTSLSSKTMNLSGSISTMKLTSHKKLFGLKTQPERRWSTISQPPGKTDSNLVGTALSVRGLTGISYMCSKNLG